MNQKKIVNEQETLRKKFIKKGVKMIAPDTVFFSKNTKIGKNVKIDPYVVLSNNVSIGDNVNILSFSHLEGVRIDNGSVVGPFARLRPGTILEKNTKVGNFVEIKKSRLSKNSKANHLSYIGDASIGKSTNIGAGTITCNYDGKDKHQTKIGDDSFVGTNSSLVAPVTVGSNAYVAAGSVITKDVPDNALGVGRSKPNNVEDWSKKKD